VELTGRTRVATYRREVGAEVARVWENVLDWEHLPWLHRTTFSRIELLESGALGWRARVGLAPDAGRVILLEVRTERDAGHYVSRTLEGPGAGTEIWTQLDPRGARTGIEVEFHVPGVPPEGAAGVGGAFERLYARLWDEDEAMMQRRARELARRAQPAAPPCAPVALGPVVELRRRLPLVVELDGERWRVVELGGELFAHATRCPHWLGPLEEARLEDDGCLRCPWHGYRFDVRTGANRDGRRLRLPPAPRVRVDPAGEASLVFG
jgi:nitrite reductase/ring-hydroxylating ferredoxin subunit